MTADELEQLGPALAASTRDAKEAAGACQVPVTDLEAAEEQAELQLALKMSARSSRVHEQLDESTRLQEHLDTTFALAQSSAGDFADEVAQIDLACSIAGANAERTSEELTTATAAVTSRAADGQFDTADDVASTAESSDGTIGARVPVSRGQPLASGRIRHKEHGLTIPVRTPEPAAHLHESLLHLAGRGRPLGRSTAAAALEPCETVAPETSELGDHAPPSVSPTPTDGADTETLSNALLDTAAPASPPLAASADTHLAGSNAQLQGSNAQLREAIDELPGSLAPG